MTTTAPTLYQKIAEGIEAMIEGGALRPGDRIPSVRQLSRQHQVSAPTVLQAYAMLENRRVIEARPRSGFYVRRRSVGIPQVLPVRRATPPAQSLAKFPPLMAMVADLADPRFVPLGGANPGADLLPGRKLARIVGAVSRDHAAMALNYDPVPGSPRLRHELSRRSLDWGCYLKPDDFLLTNGATEALHLSLRAITKPGDTVLVECPTYYGLLDILSNLGLRALAIPADSRLGLDIDAVEQALARKTVAAMVVIPNFSNPLGSLMPEANRRRLLEIAQARGIPIIEDDIYGDLQHEGDRPRCLKAFDQSGTVILCGSFSKTLAPGYRVGYVAAGAHTGQIAQLKLATNFAGAPLPAMAVAEFLRDGGYDHHLRGLRETFRRQVQNMREALATLMPPEVRISQPLGGFVLWLELPETVDALELFHQARRENISIAPGHLFSPSAEFRHFIRLSCGHPWSPAMEEAVEILARLVKHQART